MTQGRHVERLYPEPPPLAARTVLLLQSGAERGVPVMIPGAFEVRRAASAPNSPGGGTTEAPHPPVVPDSARPEKDLAGEPPSPATTSWLQRKFRALVSGSG